MTVSLQPLTADNWMECIDLTVTDDQESFVAENVFSLAQSRFYPECVPLAIYNDDEMVGFIMYDRDPDDETYWIFRLMVDAAFQRQGYGRAAVKAALKMLEKLPGCDGVYTSYSKENVAADRLFRRLGFEPTGEPDEDGELELYYSFE